MHENNLLSSLDRPANSGEVRRMFDLIAPTYDLLNTVLSMGLHRRWEALLVSQIPKDVTGSCLDLCTGTGALVPRLVKRFERVVGTDISPQMLEVGRNRWSKLSNVEWVEADAQSLPFEEETFDAITVAYGVRNIPDRERGLREMYRVCRNGGYLAVLEFGQPSNRVWRKLFSFYSERIIPLVGGLISGHPEAYRYLPKTSAKFPCGAAFEELMNSAGWIPQITIPLCGGVAFIYVAKRR